MHGRAGAALLILLLCSAMASAQDDRWQGDRYNSYPKNSRERQYNDNSRQQGQQGTPDEETACAGDAMKFCRDAIPYTFRVLACLQKNRQQISDACRGVLAAHGQ